MSKIDGSSKTGVRKLLRDVCIRTIETHGWGLTKAPGVGNAQVYDLVKGGDSRRVAIRTSQDRWIAFPRTKDDAKWSTLSEVDVVAAAVLDPEDREFARIHLFDADDLRSRFDRAYDARLKAGHSIPRGRGVWIALYEHESEVPVTLIGAGAGLATPPVARVRLDASSGSGVSSGSPAVDRAQASVGKADGGRLTPAGVKAGSSVAREGRHDYGGPLTIAEAKARLAATLGVDPSSIKITVEA